jgi:plasmid stabilization system protein ParE
MPPTIWKMNFSTPLRNWPGGPRMGHTRPDVTDRDVRFWPNGSYLIVYRQLPATLQIVAVLHGARDVPEVMRKREYPRD